MTEQLAPTVARVVVDSPLPQLDRLFDYRIPAGLAVGAGQRVRVPLRVAGRIADAFVVETDTQTAVPGPLSDVEAVVSEAAVLPAPLWQLARGVADRSAGTASDVLRVAVPKRQARVEKAWLAGTGTGPEPLPETPPVRTGVLDGYTGLADLVLEGARIALDAPPRLVRLGERTIGAWAALVAELATAVHASGRHVVLVVPDQRDSEQLEHALAASPARDAVLRFDARRGAADRYRAYLRSLEPGPHIVLGARSAVFAPVASPGLVLVWGDGDPLLAEPLAPYPHARDVALLRQAQQGGSLVLAGLSRSVAVERLVAIGHLRAVGPDRLTTPKVRLSPDDPRRARIPESAWRDAREALRAGPVLVQVARPGDASLAALRRGEQAPAIDAGRTAHELGRAFPGVRVRLADGEHPLHTVTGEPQLVVATRGAEPIPDAGYAAVLLLDGERMLARERVHVAEDCLRWWSAAASLAADGAPVHLVGVGGELGRSFATWRQADSARRMLEERRQLGFPPAVRTVTATGTPSAVDGLVTSLEAVGAGVLLVEPADEGTRAVLRFELRLGAAVAGAAKEATTKAATARRRPPVQGAARVPRPVLRVRFDDPDAL